jgi:hypothetical protein
LKFFQRYALSMPKRSRKPADLNRLAASIVDEATMETKGDEKDPAAVALGRKGGKKGGKARAAKLTPEQRSEAAKKAADARWQRPRP